ncbi:MAG: class I SAM-dependent methyltransferase, partial [Alphaproteobacteria bacterium]
GGIPPEGSYTAMLLERHGIDPRPTAHLMQPVGRPAAAAIDPSELDFSMFDTADVVNLMLQRSSTVKTRGAVRAWTEGDPGPLTAEAEARRDEILHDAFSEIAAVWQTIRGPLAELAPARLADIGCGHAFVDLLAWRELAPDLVLIDIEEGEARHFGFADEGAAYASLDKARAFLTANGVPEERITTVNPRHQPLEEIGEVDAAISLISCGFHYPARTYDRFFREQVRPGGAIILDIRKGSGGIPYLKRHGLVRVLRKEDKLARVMVTKAAA